MQYLLEKLREVGATGEVAALVSRLPAAGMYILVPKASPSESLFGCNPDGSPGRSWGWIDLI